MTRWNSRSQPRSGSDSSLTSVRPGTVLRVATDDLVLNAVESAYRQHFEIAPDRASVSFLGVEEIEVLRYADRQADHYITLGMSRHGMADPSASVVDRESAPRAELLVSVRGRPEGIVRTLAILAAAPAVEGVVYAPGNRVDTGEPLVGGSRCTGAVLRLGPLRPIGIGGDTSISVTVLELVPATATELAWARVHGTEALLDRWKKQGTSLDDLSRDAATLG